jgi:hypothetical protein
MINKFDTLGDADAGFLTYGSENGTLHNRKGDAKMRRLHVDFKFATPVPERRPE